MKVGLNVQIYFLAFVDTVRFPLRLGGVVAQLVERIVRNDKVVGSIPINSTNGWCLLGVCFLEKFPRLTKYQKVFACPFPEAGVQRTKDKNKDGRFMLSIFPREIKDSIQSA